MFDSNMLKVRGNCYFFFLGWWGAGSQSKTAEIHLLTFAIRLSTCNMPRAMERNFVDVVIGKFY